MMIVDLIDQDDFRERLVRMGVQVPAGAAPDEAARMVLQAHAVQPIPAFEDTVKDLMTHFDVMLPTVRAAIEEHLLTSMR
ncbi:hypothetical protein J2T57_000300 [Natronocella acetinitrilica]|jgi:hypothetical protein|uniref:Uncharacterized protein n=1 Tax=Natronocella acetinitrilica TaxID=414046 RepID=A0AAE3G128_9GAMM|nr:hypothetical protein [Natronocella acetinitrilica]MCP1673208.1 hypothetical protein [Natronocella acetinitrilica]